MSNQLLSKEHTNEELVKNINHFMQMLFMVWVKKIIRALLQLVVEQHSMPDGYEPAGFRT